MLPPGTFPGLSLRRWALPSDGVLHSLPLFRPAGTGAGQASSAVSSMFLVAAAGSQKTPSLFQLLARPAGFFPRSQETSSCTGEGAPAAMGGVATEQGQLVQELRWACTVLGVFGLRSVLKRGCCLLAGKLGRASGCQRG